MKLTDFLFALKPLFATVVGVISVAVITKILGIRFFDKKRKYHPVAGTVIHQLFNFTRLLDYMIDRTNHRKTYRLLSFNRSEVYTANPANIEYFLATNFSNYGKYIHGGWGAMETSEKDTKLSILNYSNWAFKSNALKLAEIVSEAAISDNIIDMQELFMEATLDSVCKVILGVDLDTMRGTYKEGTEFSNAFDEASAAAMFRYFNFLWRIMRFFNIGSEGVLRKSLSVMDEFVYELIRNKIEQVQKPQDNLPGRKETCCQGLENWKKTDPKDLRDISLSFILAGKDTTEITLSWFFYEICKNSSVQEKIEQEIRETTNVAAGSIIDELAARVTEVNLEKMQYLHASLNVTLRLHPAVPVQGKFCFSDDTWPDWI